MMVGGRSYRVDMDTKTGENAITYMDDKGGDDMQYYHCVRTKVDKDGKPILDENGNPEQETVVETFKGISLNMLPVVSTRYSTACLTHIPTETDPFNCVMLFPKGPGSNVSWSNRILEPGVYNLDISNGNDFPNSLRFSRNKPGIKGNALAAEDARLIHTGNYFYNSVGCGLPGSSFTLNHRFELKKDKKIGPITNPIIYKKGWYTDTAVWKSQATEEVLKEKVESFVKDKKGNFNLQAVMGKTFDELKEENK